MKRIHVVLLGLVLLASVIAFAGEVVVPRVYNIFLFDNATGVQATKLAIIFDQEVVFDASNIIVFGGGVPEMVAVSTTFAFIDVVVDAGGTLQLVLPPDYAGATVMQAFWFE